MKTNPASIRNRKLDRNIIMLGIVSLFTDAASEMIYPLVPVFITLLGSSVLVLGVIEGIAETTAAMLKLASGIISDRIGKRKLLVVIGYGISSLIRPLTGLVSSAWQIVLIRMTDRVGKGIRTAPRDALIAASVDDQNRGRAYGLHRGMDHAGAVIGPFLAIVTLVILILGFGLHDSLLTLRYTFMLALIPGALSILTLVLFVKEKGNEHHNSLTSKFSLKQFDRNFLVYLVVILIFTLGNSSDAFLLFRVQDAIHSNASFYDKIFTIPVIGDMVRGWGPPEAQKQLIDILYIPLVWAFFHVIKVVFSAPLGALSDRIGRRTVISIGWTIYTSVYVAFAFLEELPADWQITATFILFAVYALYYAFCEGAEKAYVADMVSGEKHGSAFGLYNFSVGLGALPASVLFGAIYKCFGAPAAFITGAVLACIALLLLVFAIKD